MKQKISGVIAPVLTPFDEALVPDTARFIAHCRWLVDNGAGLAIFGTNSEAASLSVVERIDLTDSLLAADIPAASLLPGTGACSLSDAVELTRHASRAGAAGVLTLPPFFFKGVSEDGLFAYYAELIERVGEGCAPIYLYHIPQFTCAPITMGLIERLLKRYPSVVAGAKDSSGDWANSREMIERFAADGFAVFPASETLLPQGLAIGGAGCISATVNVNPAAIRKLYESWDSAEGRLIRAQTDAVRLAFQGGYNMIAAMKCVIARAADHAAWQVVRPPLTRLSDAAAGELLDALANTGFQIADYPRRISG